MSEIERVMPIPGASVVQFDYDAAEDALAAVLHTLPEVVGGQVESRTDAGVEAATDWSGHFRGEFDDAEGNLLTRFTDTASWGPVGPMGEIYAAAGRANDRQREYNEARQAVIDEERESEPSGG